uniref:Uncharacterized protein n=1 Tax=Tanacetum cinerariifolium TaxID=118510 RepID=A0A699KE70_TANCI|nr:hypothetical protein [Tanacetum cinerariifolium]
MLILRGRKSLEHKHSLNLNQLWRSDGEGPLTLEESKLKIEEIKRLADLKAVKDKSEKKLKRVLTPQELKAQEEELAAYEAKRAERIEENNHCITFGDYPLHITKLSYMWLTTQAGKLGIPPPTQLTVFELPTASKKKKRNVEIIHEVFIEENIVVDGMQRNLSLPEIVVGKAGQ